MEVMPLLLLLYERMVYFEMKMEMKRPQGVENKHGEARQQLEKKGGAAFLGPFLGRGKRTREK